MKVKVCVNVVVEIGVDVVVAVTAVENVIFDVDMVLVLLIGVIVVCHSSVR